MNITIEFFDGHASHYDVYQQSCIPRYREVLSVATEWLDRVMAERHRPRILDLGCGTGNTTAELFRLFPNGVVACIDCSREMLAMARRKLQSHAVESSCSDLRQRGWNAQLIHAPVDAVVSVFVLEHLPFDNYRQVIADLLQVMKPGAVSL